MPTQLPTQGQWWSWVRTHLPQSWQCFERKGCCSWQRLHHRSSTPERQRNYSLRIMIHEVRTWLGTGAYRTPCCVPSHPIDSYSMQLKRIHKVRLGLLSTLRLSKEEQAAKNIQKPSKTALLLLLWRCVNPAFLVGVDLHSPTAFLDAFINHSHLDTAFRIQWIQWLIWSQVCGRFPASGVRGKVWDLSHGATFAHTQAAAQQKAAGARTRSRLTLRALHKSWICAWRSDI